MDKRNKSKPTSMANPVILITLIALLYSITGCQPTVSPVQDPSLENLDVSELKMTMLADIATTIFSDGELDNDVKTDIAKKAISPLRKSSEVLIAGSDEKTRPVAVSFQKAFEQSLLNMVNEEQVNQVAAIIHTRKPTTPLCNPPGVALSQTLSPDMQCDSKRCKTIEDRTITLRNIARHGPPMDLYIAYLPDGLEKRSQQEQDIYKRVVSDEENQSLHDEMLSCTDMPDEIVGASYLLKTRRGNTLYFANNGTQAIDGKGDTHWRYWFGNLKDSAVRLRYKKVFQYLKDCGMDINI